jgi:hypothetical protein
MFGVLLATVKWHARHLNLTLIFRKKKKGSFHQQTALNNTGFAVRWKDWVSSPFNCIFFGG